MLKKSPSPDKVFILISYDDLIIFFNKTILFFAHKLIEQNKGKE